MDSEESEEEYSPIGHPDAWERLRDAVELAQEAARDIDRTGHQLSEIDSESWGDEGNGQPSSLFGYYALENDLFPEMSMPIGEQCLECRDRQPGSKGEDGNSKSNSSKGQGKGKGKHSDSYGDVFQ